MATSKKNRKWAVLEGSERSGETSKTAVAASAATPPDPEVPAQATRRRFSARYKLKILEQADQCQGGELGALLRREGLYHSNLQTWRRQRREGTLRALAPRKRGRKAQPVNPLSGEVRRLQRQNRQLQRKLQQAEIMLEIQKKTSQMLGIALEADEEEEES